MKNNETLFIFKKNNDSWEFAVIANGTVKAVEKLEKKFPKEDFANNWTITNHFNAIIE